MDSDDELEFTVDPEPEYLHVNILDTPVSTTLTTSQEMMHKWIREHRHSTEIMGLDIQLADRFTPFSGIATIQVCVEGQVLIYHMYNDSDTSAVLQNFLADYRNTFVGFNLERGLELLKYQTRGYSLGRYINLVSLAALHYRQRGLVHADMSQLAWTVLQRELAMPEVDPAGWDQAVLDDDHVAHACARAYLSYQMGRAIHA